MPEGGKLKSGKRGDDRDFVARQYANLLASGLDEQVARDRLEDVLGAAAVRLLDPHDSTQAGGAGRVANGLAAAATEAGGDAAAVYGAFALSCGEARLFALDWWRPIRAFLLYVLFLLAFAVFLSAFYVTSVLPKFVEFDKLTGVGHGGAAGWILAGDSWRLFAPLVLAAILILLFVIVLYALRWRLSRLAPLAGLERWPWLYGRSGSGYRLLLYLEYLAILVQGRVAASSAIGLAQRWACRGEQKVVKGVGGSLGKRLEKADRLGTFDAELEWQRRRAWSVAQSRLELSRDRLILFSRVVFYLLIGYLVTVLYLPIFTLAMNLRSL